MSVEIGERARLDATELASPTFFSFLIVFRQLFCAKSFAVHMTAEKVWPSTVKVVKNEE